MNKATHTGICQACGRILKVQGELIAKHDFEEGYFEGKCSGSNQLPYEKSRDLLKILVADIKQKRNALKEKIYILQAGHIKTLGRIDTDNSEWRELDMHINFYKGYINWQQGRFMDWERKELESIK